MKTDGSDGQDPRLHPEQLADLLKSGLSHETIAHLGVGAVRPHDLKLVGVSLLRPRIARTKGLRKLPLNILLHPSYNISSLG
jgi:hypothetical protein